MKLLDLVALAAFVVVVNAGSYGGSKTGYRRKTPEEIEQYRVACAAQFKIPQELQDRHVKSEYPDDELTHKSIRCVSEKIGTWNVKDGYVKQYMLIQFGNNKKSIIDRCVTTRYEKWTAEKWAWNNWKCLVEGGITRPAM